MEQDKKYTAKDAAVAVLKKAEEMLKKSELLKKSIKEAQPEKTDKAYETKAGKSKNIARVEEQKDPNKNPKEKAEGNNMAPGAFPQNTMKYSMEGADAAKMGKAEGKDYPQDLASKNIEEHMKHKDKHPGGEKQAVAIGIEQAREGKEEKAEEAFIPHPHKGGVAALKKFMEYKHAKRKAQ